MKVPVWLLACHFPLLQGVQRLALWMELTVLHGYKTLGDSLECWSGVEIQCSREEPEGCRRWLFKGVREYKVPGKVKQGKCKVTGLGTSWDCQQHCAAHTDPISTWVGARGGGNWISVPSAGAKSCILPWPRHGQLSGGVYQIHTPEDSVWCLHLFLAHCSVYIIALSLCLAHLKQSLLFFLSPNNAENFTLFILYGSISTL